MNKNVYTKWKYLNPFHDLFEKNAKTNARTLRTSFFGKLGDAIKVFVGTNSHFGLFDYLLVVPFLIEKADEWLKTREEGRFYNKKYSGLSNFATTLLEILTGLLKPIFNLIRYVAVYPFIIVALPFIGIAHGISKIEGDSLKSTIDQWLGVDGMSSDDIKIELNSGSELQESNHQILIRLIKNIHSSNESNSQIIEKMLNFDQDKNVIEALVSLNVGGKAQELSFFKDRIEQVSFDMADEFNTSISNEF